ncbi:MAG: hypothetical protein JXX28_14320 [Deltaproteobacteria bacterium]|nr:hypothetical protein [Deltaproteobacteria bacterium]
MKRALFASLLLLSTAGWALIPPMSTDDLLDEASVLVTGTVVETHQVGAPEADSCYYWQRWEGTLRVESVEKGEADPMITLVWRSREGDVSREHPCIGGSDSYYLQRGGRYRLYLSGSGGRYGPFHRDGVQSLPALPAPTEPAAPEAPAGPPTPEAPATPEP